MLYLAAFLFGFFAALLALRTLLVHYGYQILWGIVQYRTGGRLVFETKHVSILASTLPCSECSNHHVMMSVVTDNGDEVRGRVAEFDLSHGFIRGFEWARGINND